MSEGEREGCGGGAKAETVMGGCIQGIFWARHGDR